MDVHLLNHAIQAEAFHTAMAELIEGNPQADTDPKLKEEVVMAILDLARAGQTDPQRLARYAISKCRK